VPIPKIPADIRNYLADFNLIAIAITTCGRVVLCENPTGHAAAWWLARKDGNRLLEEVRGQIRRHDVQAAAKRLRIRIVEHATCMARTDQALGRLDDILRNAKANGGLKTFHEAYRKRREAAFLRGESYMPFSTARKRLERTLTRCIASETQGDPFVLALSRCFDESARPPPG
jgi:hypothetical protein